MLYSKKKENWPGHIPWYKMVWMLHYNFWFRYHYNPDKTIPRHLPQQHWTSIPSSWKPRTPQYKITRNTEIIYRKQFATMQYLHCRLDDLSIGNEKNKLVDVNSILIQTWHRLCETVSGETIFYYWSPGIVLSVFCDNIYPFTIFKLF